MNWLGLNWTDIILGTVVLAIIPFVLAAYGGHLAAEAIADKKRSRNTKLKFWVLAIIGVGLAFWQQLRAAQSDLDKQTSDAWMSIVAASTYPRLIPPSFAYTPTPQKAIPPDVAGFLHFGPDKLDILLNVVSASGSLANAPLFDSVLWDVDTPDNPKNPLQIPAQSNPTGYVRKDMYWGPFNLISSNSERRVKKGDRIFGFFNVSCPLCLKSRVYWVYAVIGEEGWYAEASKDGSPSLDLISKNFEAVKANPGGTWQSVLAHTKPKMQIANPL